MSAQADPKLALDVFVEKVQAFRSTLNVPEQKLLDQVMAGVMVDVAAHAVEPSFAIKFAVPPQAAVDPAVSLQKLAAMERASDAAVDVAAHAMQPKLTQFAFKVAADGRYSVEAFPPDAALSNERVIQE